MIRVKWNNTKAENRIDHVSIANYRRYNASILIRFFLFNNLCSVKGKRGGVGGGGWRLALRRIPTNVEDQQDREREGLLGIWRVGVGGGGS